MSWPEAGGLCAIIKIENIEEKHVIFVREKHNNLL